MIITQKLKHTFKIVNSKWYHREGEEYLIDFIPHLTYFHNFREMNHVLRLSNYRRHGISGTRRLSGREVGIR
jgi:hypothetical protein